MKTKLTEIQVKLNKRYEKAIKSRLEHRPEGVSEHDWREYKKWAKEKLKSNNPLGFEET